MTGLGKGLARPTQGIRVGLGLQGLTLAIGSRDYSSADTDCRMSQLQKSLGHLDTVMEEECLHDWAGVGEASGLDDDIIQLFLTRKASDCLGLESARGATVLAHEDCLRPE